MTYSQEIQKGSVRINALTETDLAHGTEHFALRDAETAEAAFEGRIENLGAIQREVSNAFSGLRSGGMSQTLLNEDAALSKWDPDKIPNRIHRVYGVAGGKVKKIFTGTIKSFEYSSAGRLTLQISDTAESYFGATNQWWIPLTLRASEWGSLPSDSAGKVAPLVIGDHDSRGAGFGGMLPTVQVSPTEFLCAGHAMKCVSRVFNGGKHAGAGFRVELDHAWTKGINGRCTLLTFNEAPEGVVTIDGQGLTDDLTSDGKLCTNPVDVMETLREHVFGLADENVSPERIGASRDWADKYHLRVAGLVGQKMLALDVMSHILANSFLSGGVDQDGLWSIWPLNIPLDPEAGTLVSERDDILEQSLSIRLEDNTIVNKLFVAYLKRARGGSHLGQVELEHADSQTDLGREYGHNLSLDFCAERECARTVGELTLLVHGYAITASWGDMLHHSELDLGSQIALTSRFGPSVSNGGWSARCMGIRGINFEPAKGFLQIQAQDWSRATSAALGVGMVIGGDLPGEVL
jgi:hypothetical protein